MGWSFAVRTAPVSLVARHGRVLERPRFPSRAGSERAREHAFQKLELADPAPEDESHEMEHVEVPDFSGFCGGLLSVDPWHIVDCGRFVRDEDIWPFETRSALRSVHSAWNVRFLFLLDNVALVLLLTKGRTLSFPVHALIRRIYGIAYRIWFPSGCRLR